MDDERGTSREQRPVAVVPLEAQPGLAGPVSRCESCGLAQVGEPGDAREALAELDRLGGADGLRIVNRRSLSAWIGGAGWAGLEPASRYVFTVEAVRRLVANRDQIVRRARWSPATGIATMWQTLLNGVTFGRNVGLSALGRREAVPASRPWQRKLDAIITVLAAIPALIAAIPLELAAAAAKRGSAAILRLELL